MANIDAALDAEFNSVDSALDTEFGNVDNALDVEFGSEPPSMSLTDKIKTITSMMPGGGPIKAAATLIPSVIPSVAPDDPNLPKAKVGDVPGIVKRGVVSAELGVAKGLIGTIDAAINIPREDVHKVATPWMPSQFVDMDTGLSNKLREAKRRIQSAQKKFGRRYSGALAWTTRTVSEAVPYMANALAAGVVVGPVGAATVGFVVEGDNAYDEAIASGATEEQAQTERVVIGSINAIIEAIQIGRVVKFAKGGKHSLKNFVKLARTKGIKYAGKELKGWTGEVARLSIEEALEEFSQEGVLLSVPAIFRDEYPRKEDGTPDWMVIGERLGEAALGGAVAGPVLGGAGRVLTGPQTDVAREQPPILGEEGIKITQEIPSDLKKIGVQAYVMSKEGNVYVGSHHGAAYNKLEDAGDTQKDIRDSGFVIDGKLVSDSKISRGEAEKAVSQGVPPNAINVFRGKDTGKIYPETPDGGETKMEQTEDGTRIVATDTGEELVLDQELSKSVLQTDQIPAFPVTEADIVADDTATAGKSTGLGRAVQLLVDEGMSFEDAQTVVRGSQKGGKATVDITESKEMRDKLISVEKAIEPNEQNPSKIEQEDKLSEPEFSEPGIGSLITSKRIVMQRIGADRLTGPLLAAKEKMQVIKGTLNKEVNKVIKSLRKRASFGDKVASRIMKRQTKPVRRMVDLLDTYERLPKNITKELSAAEVEAFNKLRDMTKWLLERTNIARRKAGLDTINDLKAYIPHWIDSVANEIIDGTYPYKSGYLARLMKGVPKNIKNRTAYHRELTRKIQDNMEQDLGRLMKGLISYDLHDMLLTNPQAQVWDELHQLQTDGKIPDSTYNAIANFINYDILDRQAPLDKAFNNAGTVKTTTEWLNKVLRPLNREISNPALFYFGGMRKLMHAAFMPFRPRPATRNLGQRLLNLTFYRGRDLLKAQFGRQDRIADPETGKQIKVLDLVRKQDWYKLTKPEDTLDDRTILSRLTSAGMIAFKKAHVGNRYVSNVEVSALTAYYDWKHRFIESRNKNSKYYTRIIEHSKRTGIPVEQLQTQQEDMMNDIRDGVQMTQWEYMSHGMPTLFRGQTARGIAAYQSWWMNYFMSHTAEGWNRMITGRTRVRGDGTGGRLLSRGARFRAVNGMGAIYGAARIVKTATGIAMLGALWMPDPTNSLPPILNLAVIMARLLLGFGQPEKRKQAWSDLKKNAARLLPFNSAARDIAKVGDDWTLKDYVFYTENMEWKQIWVPVKPK